jgi:hypothetical protein
LQKWRERMSKYLRAELAGYKNYRFEGSWSDWSKNPDLRRRWGGVAEVIAIYIAARCKPATKQSPYVSREIGPSLAMTSTSNRLDAPSSRFKIPVIENHFQLGFQCPLRC